MSTRRVAAVVKPIKIGGHGRAFVTPPQISIGEGRTRLAFLTLRNGTSKKAWFWFPSGDRVCIPPEGKDFLSPIDIAAGGFLKLVVRKKPKHGNYHYHLYCEAVHDCAQGNSEPRISVP
jgi:hypothetical protein